MGMWEIAVVEKIGCRVIDALGLKLEAKPKAA